MNRLLGHIKWLLRSRRTRQLDERAMAIADKYGMRKEYLEARKFGFSPLEALEDWDLIQPEERALFLEPYSTTTEPQNPHCGRLLSLSKHDSHFPAIETQSEQLKNILNLDIIN